MDNNQRIEIVKKDRDHGSRWLAHEAVSTLHEIATSSYVSEDEQMLHIQMAARELAQARPGMAAIAGAVSRVLKDGHTPGEIALNASKLLSDYQQVPRQIAEQIRPFLHGSILTLSTSGTLQEAISRNKEQIDEVIVMESRPQNEGRGTAASLAAQGMRVTLITDAQAGIFLPMVQAVLVGTDTILANGDVLNKAGTSLLAWAAKGQNIPFYVLGETLKVSSHRWQNGDLHLLEEMGPEEVLEQAPEGITIHNYSFDRTPADLITAIISENGPLSREEITEIAASLQI